MTLPVVVDALSQVCDHAVKTSSERASENTTQPTTTRLMSVRRALTVISIETKMNDMIKATELILPVAGSPFLLFMAHSPGRS